MRHTLRNLFLVVLMGYSLSALPLNPELATLDLSRFSYENAVKNQAIQGRITYAYILDAAQKPLANPEKVDFLILAKGGKKPKWTEPPKLVLEVVSEGKTVKTLSGAEFSTFAQPKAEFNPYELKYTLELSRQALKLDGSTYLLRIHGDDSALSGLAPLEIPVQYLDRFTYIPARTSASSGKQMVVSYFADSSGTYAVPVSRELPKSGKLFRTAVNQLNTAPLPGMALRTEVLAPRVSSIQYANGLITCRLSAPVAPSLYSDPRLAAIAVRTMTDSIAAIESPYRISKVKYVWNGAAPVPGWPLEEIPVNTAQKVWLALSIPGNRVLLVPHTTESTAPEALMALLQKGTGQLLPTVPGQARLLGSRLEGDVLVLRFEKGFSGLFSGSSDQAALTLDSLVNTFGILPGVKSLRLEEGDSRIQDLGGIPLPEALGPSPYVNPESAFAP